jgi:methionyl-tRNA synthetase
MGNSENLLNQNDKITIEDLGKIKLVVAKVLSCEAIKRSKKLLKLTLDDGNSERIVVSGISEYYLPSELVGHNVVLISNLKPAKLCGVESNEMILSAKHGEVVKIIMMDDMPAGSEMS